MLLSPFERSENIQWAGLTATLMLFLMQHSLQKTSLQNLFLLQKKNIQKKNQQRMMESLLYVISLSLLIKNKR